MEWLELWRVLPADLRWMISGSFLFLALALAIGLWWYSAPRCAICGRRHPWGGGLTRCAGCGRRFCAGGMGEERYTLKEPPDAEPYTQRSVILPHTACGARRLTPWRGRQTHTCRHCLEAEFPLPAKTPETASGEGA